MGRFSILATHGLYSTGTLSFSKMYWTVSLGLFEIAAAEMAFVLPALRRIVLRGRRRGGEGEVRMIRFIRDTEHEEVLVDRADEDAAVWGFAPR